MTRRKSPLTIQSRLLLVCLLAATLFAQNPYGRITGRVIDSSAAVVPGAVVRVENTGTNVETTVVSDSFENLD